MTIEIVWFPMKSGDFPWHSMAMSMLNYQRVNHDKLTGALSLRPARPGTAMVKCPTYVSYVVRICTHVQVRTSIESVCVCACVSTWVLFLGSTSRDIRKS